VKERLIKGLFPCPIYVREILHANASWRKDNTYIMLHYPTQDRGKYRKFGASSKHSFDLPSMYTVALADLEIVRRS
jgi:hypothetical protein